MYRLNTDNWYLERILFLVAGCMITLSVILILIHSIYWIILTAFVGLNLLIFALTGFCPSAIAFCRMGPSHGCRGQRTKRNRRRINANLQFNQYSVALRKRSLAASIRVSRHQV